MKTVSRFRFIHTTPSHPKREIHTNWTLDGSYAHVCTDKKYWQVGSQNTVFLETGHDCCHTFCLSWYYVSCQTAHLSNDKDVNQNTYLIRLTENRPHQKGNIYAWIPFVYQISSLRIFVIFLCLSRKNTTEEGWNEPRVPVHDFSPLKI
jgi:hypothetical protein